jgi:hypothetical protein
VEPRIRPGLVCSVAVGAPSRSGRLDHPGPLRVDNTFRAGPISNLHPGAARGREGRVGESRAGDPLGEGRAGLLADPCFMAAHRVSCFPFHAQRSGHRGPRSRHAVGLGMWPGRPAFGPRLTALKGHKRGAGVGRGPREGNRRQWSSRDAKGALAREATQRYPWNRGANNALNPAGCSRGSGKDIPRVKSK